MALTTYAELQTAIQTELDITETTFVAAIPDMVNRAEAKINRKCRLREMETIGTDTYSAATASLADRTMSLPTGYVELIGLKHKVATAADNTYEEVKYVEPNRIQDYYGASTVNELYYTLRASIEFNAAVGVDHTIQFHYLKGWDLATDSTNWLLTNYPDVYLYGALVEASVFLVNDARAVGWKTLFEEGMRDLNELSERGRDDAVLDIGDLAAMSGHSNFNILTG